jgi:hypothetical protein
MANNRVRVGSLYIYHANLRDATDGRTNLKTGEVVKVVNMHGCPPANTMGHCYVVRKDDVTTFVGLVHTNSLHSKKDYAAYLRERIAEIERKKNNPVKRD